MKLQKIVCIKIKLSIIAERVKMRFEKIIFVGTGMLLGASGIA